MQTTNAFGNVSKPNRPTLQQDDLISSTEKEKADMQNTFQTYSGASRKGSL